MHKQQQGVNKACSGVTFAQRRKLLQNHHCRSHRQHSMLEEHMLSVPDKSQAINIAQPLFSSHGAHMMLTGS